jgi:ubiquinol-cytochrome c reductase iron-sulfur subunit
MPTSDSTADSAAEPTRRDFIHILGTAVAGMGAVGALVPLVHQMNPDASVLALATKDVDLSGIEVGQGVKVMWQGKPVFIRHRTPQEIERARETPLSLLKDEVARNRNIETSAPATDQNRAIKPEYLVLVGVCTHLGCVPLGTGRGESRGEYGGWFCPCHGSHYDLAGRIRKGPAPENLQVPPYQYLSDTVIRIG